VTLRARARNGTAELVVADDGPGLSADDATHVFERFYTADSAGGAGLGLAIARELADRMSGGIRVRTRPGETVFTLRLPAAGDGAP
jgi:signal transduction histidine kinase